MRHGAVPALGTPRRSARTLRRGAALVRCRRMARLTQHGLRRVLGTSALFSTAYGNVGSSIYYALGLVASYALGLTPIVFLITGGDLLPDRRHLRRGDRDVPRGRRLLELRAPRLQRAVVVLRGVGADAQLHDHDRHLGVLRAALPRRAVLARAAARARRHLFGIGVVACCRSINVVGVKEAAGLNIVLAVTDLATQLLLVIVGVVLVLSPHVLIDNVHLGVAPSWKNFLVAIPVGMIAYTGIETISNMAEEARDETRTDPARDQGRRRRRVRDLRRAADGRAVGAAGAPSGADGKLLDAARHRRGPRRLRRRPGARDRQAPAPRRAAVGRGDLRRPARRDDPVHRRQRRASSAPRGWSTRWACTARSPTASAACTRASRTPWIGILLFGGVACLTIIPGKAEFLGNMYAFGAMLSFTIAHLSVIRLRIKEPDRAAPIPRARDAARRAGASCPLFALLGIFGTGLAFVVVTVLHLDVAAAGVALAGARHGALHRLPPPAGPRPAHDHARRRAASARRTSRSSTTARRSCRSSASDVSARRCSSAPPS